MKKKILKNLCKVFICLLLIYLIYVVANIICVNKKIDEVVASAVINSEEDGLKKFSYQKKKMFYFLGKVHFMYEICIADPEDVLESGTHLKELLNNFDEKYIAERRILKSIAKKAGTYDDRNEEIGLEWFFYDSQHYSDRAFYNLLKKTAYQEEREYSGNEIEVLPVKIEYNIFTHEFENLDSFSDKEYGELFIYRASLFLQNSNVKKDEFWFAMYKPGERELRLIEFNGKVVSVYENFENEYPLSDFESYIESYVENKYEKYIIENNLSVDEAITYLKSQGYKFGRSMVLKNDKDEEVELVFDGDHLLWFNKESITNEVMEKVNYLFENNTSKAEITRELENMGYYQRKEYFYQDPQDSESLIILNNDNDSDLINQGCVKVEEVFFYNPEEGYITTYFDNENIVFFIGHDVETLSGKLEQFVSEKLSKAEVIEELIKYGFEIEL